MRDSFLVSVIVGLGMTAITSLALVTLYVSIDHPWILAFAILIGLAAFGSSLVIERLTSDR